jgi:hypothetical protein
MQCRSDLLKVGQVSAKSKRRLYQTPMGCLLPDRRMLWLGWCRFAGFSVVQGDCEAGVGAFCIVFTRPGANVKKRLNMPKDGGKAVLAMSAMLFCF